MAQKSWCYVPVSPNLKVKIDREDLERVDKHKWRITYGTTGRRRVVTSFRDGKKVRQVTLGRFLMNPAKNKQVYPRRFNDELDYRKENLIVCTLRERQRLLPKNRRKTSSVFRGVSYLSGVRKWRAGIEVSGHSINLGNFDSEIDAALAYNEAAKKHFGSDAYLNQVHKKFRNRRRD